MNVYALILGGLVICSLCLALETGPLNNALRIDEENSQPAAGVHRRQKRTFRLIGEAIAALEDKIASNIRLHRLRTYPYNNWADMPAPGYPVYGQGYGFGYPPIYGPGVPPVYNPGYGPINGPGYNPGYPAYGPGFPGYGPGFPGYGPGQGQGIGPGYQNAYPGYGSGYNPGSAPGNIPGGSFGPGYVGPTTAPGYGPKVQPITKKPCSYDPQIDDDSAQCW